MKNILKKFLFIMCLIICNFINEIKISFIYSKKLKLSKFYSDKWVVMTTISPPKPIINKLLKLLKGWKILVIGDIKTNNENWRIFNDSNILIYLSINDQLNLNYQTLKYTSLNSYCRKNIGYLFAIEHGAKEIYEIDENIISNFKYLNYNFNNSNYDKLSIGNINKQMINPYSYFGINNIWPRGFRIDNLGKDFNIEFFSLSSNQIKLNPIIYQNLINGNPDLDSIFILTRTNNKNRFNITFTERNSLLYFPGNYVPINSKNTKYLYDIFPLLALPTTINSEKSDIFRGFIIQRYAWRFNGTVIFVPSDSFKNQSFINKSEFIKKEKNLYYKLDELIRILNHKSNNKIKDPRDFAINIIKKLIYKKILQRKDLKMYNAFLNDLVKFWFSYYSSFQRVIELNLTNCFKEFSKLKLNLISQDKILLLNNQNNNLKLLKHKSSYKKYNDILLAINYNFKNLININNKFLFSIYNKYFPNIIFISPEIESDKNIISCPNSGKGGLYAYMYFRKVYEKFPYMKGYLIIDDDYFIKPWELENYDFNIPWINEIFIRRILPIKIFKKNYIYLDNQINNNIYYSNNNISKSFGFNTIPYLWVELLYFPKSIIIEFFSLVEEMYNNRIILELAIPTAIGFLYFKGIQIINSILIWYNDRNYMENYLKNSLNNVGIHPFKFKYEFYKNLIIEYITFIKYLFLKII